MGYTLDTQVTAAEGETATKDNKEGVRVLGRVFLCEVLKKDTSRDVEIVVTFTCQADSVSPAFA